MPKISRKAMIIAIFLLCANIVSAKVYWLPDYLGDNANRSNASEKDTDKDGIVPDSEENSRGCPNGWLTAAEIGNKVCVAQASFPWVGVCYSDCVCNTEIYKFTADNCKGTKAPSGDTWCEDNGTIYYPQCIDACDAVEDKTINPDWGCIKTYDSCPLECETPYSNNCHNISGTPISDCPYGCKISYENKGCDSECQECYADNCHITQGSPLTDCKYECKTTYETEGCSTECKECYPDKCHTLTNKEPCPYGCEVEFTMAVDECDTGCKQCYADNCRNTPGTPKSSCPYGCDSQGTYEAEGCSSECKACNTCQSTDCSDYPSTSIPSNATYSSCVDTCGVNPTKYKIDSCNRGYTQSGNSCIESSCSSGYATSTSNCGSSFSNGYWSLGTSSNGYSGSNKCYKCTRTCNSGYSLSGNSCVKDDPCDKYTGKYCDVCKTTYSDCSTKCQECCDFEDHKLSSCPSYGNCTDKTCGNVKRYKLNGCQSGYALNTSGTTCEKLPNGAIKLTYQVAAGGKINLNLTGTSGTIDWGDNNVTNISTDSHTYSSAGKYQITITGKVTVVGPITPTNAYVLSFDQLDLETVTHAYNSSFSNKSFAGDCTKATGSIPSKLPPKLVDAEYMFAGCNLLEGDIPELPETLTSARFMFYECKGLNGTINNSNLGGTQITDGTYMFAYCNNLEGSIPGLPEKLSKATYMFADCRNLSGNIPDFPKSLNNGDGMFKDCRNLVGSIPDNLNLTYLTDGSYMFQNCRWLTGSLPKLPDSLTKANYMFDGCQELTGEFSDTSLPSKLTSASYMFSDCHQIGGRTPAFPENLTSASGMFNNC